MCSIWLWYYGYNTCLLFIQRLLELFNVYNNY